MYTTKIQTHWATIEPRQVKDFGSYLVSEASTDQCDLGIEGLSMQECKIYFHGAKQVAKQSQLLLLGMDYFTHYLQYSDFYGIHIQLKSDPHSSVLEHLVWVLVECSVWFSLDDFTGKKSAHRGAAFLYWLTCQSADIMLSLCIVGIHVCVNNFSKTTRPRDMLFFLNDTLF